MVLATAPSRGVVVTEVMPPVGTVWKRRKGVHAETTVLVKRITDAGNIIVESVGRRGSHWSPRKSDGSFTMALAEFHARYVPATYKDQRAFELAAGIRQPRSVPTDLDELIRLGQANGALPPPESESPVIEPPTEAVEDIPNSAMPVAAEPLSVRERILHEWQHSGKPVRDVALMRWGIPLGQVYAILREAGYTPRIDPEQRARWGTLEATSRRARIVALHAEGKSANQIAAELGVAPRVVTGTLGGIQNRKDKSSVNNANSKGSIIQPTTTDPHIIEQNHVSRNHVSSTVAAAVESNVVAVLAGDMRVPTSVAIPQLLATATRPPYEPAVNGAAGKDSQPRHYWRATLEGSCVVSGKEMLDALSEIAERYPELSCIKLERVAL